jgi:small-conductance mechanosensitive channel
LIEERTIPLFDIASKLVVIGGATYALLGIWQLNPAPWFASAGVIGIAVGFAARDTLANLFAGIFIIADGPYKLGDFITLDSGERGLVTHVGVRSTRLLTRDDIEITLPNAVIANAKILNESGGRWPKERIRVKVGVAYGSDVDQVCATLIRIAERHDHICAEPEPRVRLRAFGDSSLDFELLCWIDEPVLRGKLTHEMLMDVYKTFAKEEIEIPFPQRDVWVRQLAAPEREATSTE